MGWLVGKSATTQFCTVESCFSPGHHPWSAFFTPRWRRSVPDMTSARDVEAVGKFVRETLGIVSMWDEPLGYPESLALCAIDAVYSLRSRYTATIRVLNRYRTYRRQQGGDPDTGAAPSTSASSSIPPDSHAWRPGAVGWRATRELPLTSEQQPECRGRWVGLALSLRRARRPVGLLRALVALPLLTTDARCRLVAQPNAGTVRTVALTKAAAHYDLRAVQSIGSEA